MSYSPKIPYLVNQIILGKLTYKEIVAARPELQEQADKYIEKKGLIIDKTV
jgi:hypothetical protein